MSLGTGVIDFDGVLHSYTSGWKGEEEIPDPPTEGAVEWVEMITEAGYRAVVASTRAKEQLGREAMALWLGRNGFPTLEIAYGKPPALWYVDDRAVRFPGPGRWPTLEELREAAIPWNKR